MKKILIISYFFPPANFVGAERTSAWTEYLYKRGYYPIIITRHWNQGQTDIVDKVLNNQLEHLIYDSHEVYRLPHKRTLRDFCSNYKILRPLQKFLSFYEIVFSNIFVNTIPYSNIYQKARNILHNDPSIKIVIASGRPFQSFFFGHKLKKEFDVLWIPDYRDEWTTYQRPWSKGFMNKLILKLDKRSEKKWTSNCDGFISVSDHSIEQIDKYICKKGHLIMNGYSELKYQKNALSSNESLNLLYAGTLYPNQPIELILEAISSLHSSNFHSVKIKFIGVNVFTSEMNRLKNLSTHLSNVEILDRMSKSQIDIEMNKADILLLTKYDYLEGVYPAKLFEYYASGTPILLCPSDNDVMASFINDTNCGTCVNSKRECEEALLNWANDKRNGKPIVFERDMEEGKKYSREYQTYKLAAYLDTISNNTE